MAIDIVDQVPRGAWLPRARRRLRSFLGTVLILTGLLASIPPVLIVLLLAVIGDTTSPGQAPVTQLALMCMAATLCLVVGLRLKRGKRWPVLFLRKFGFAGSSEAVTFAVGTALGQRWRLITLDDTRLIPVGVYSHTRRILGWGRWITLTLFVGGVIYAATWIHGETPDNLLADIATNVFETSMARGDNLFAAIVGAIVVTIMVGIVVLSIAILFIFGSVAIFGTASLFSWGAWRAVLRAERSTALDIQNADQISGAVARVVKRTRGIFAPRLIVLRTAHDIWQQVVRSFADAARVVLIDISEPTENLLWELEALEAAGRPHRVLIGRHDRVKALAHGDIPGVDRSLVARLQVLLDGEQVIVYGGESRSAMRRFAGRIHAYLEGLEPMLDRQA